MRRFQRRQDTSQSGERLERFERLGVADMRVFRAPERPQPCVLRSNGRVVEAGRHRMCQLDVAVLVLQDKRTGTLEDAGAAAGEACGVAALRNLLSARLDADQ